MFSALAYSLDNNVLTNPGKNTHVTGFRFNDMSGILKLAEALPHSQLTSLRWPTSHLNFAWTLCLCLLLRQQPMTLLTFGLSLVQPPKQRASCRGLQGSRGCARQDPDHVSEVRQSHPFQRLNLAWTLCICLPLRQ